MTYGHLTVITGPMYAGKTTEWLKTLLWEQHKGKGIVAIKPAFDNRYSDNDVVSHDGMRASVESITSWKEVEERILEAKHIFFDEIQFFMQPYFDGDIISIIKNCLCEGKDVVVNGLDMDWQGNAFDITAKLMAMSDTLVKKKAHCSICGKPAVKTFKKVANGDSVELGASELYEPRCNVHFYYENQ